MTGLLVPPKPRRLNTAYVIAAHSQRPLSAQRRLLDGAVAGTRPDSTERCIEVGADLATSVSRKRSRSSLGFGDAKKMTASGPTLVRTRSLRRSSPSVEVAPLLTRQTSATQSE